MVFRKRLYCVVVSMFVLVSCATMKGDWEKAVSDNTIPAYENFVKKHPQGEFTQEAKTKLSDLYAQRDWQSAQTADTVTAYEAFLQTYPDNALAQDARKRLEELRDWQSTQITNTIMAYETFVQKYPKGTFVQEARKQIEEMDWQTAKNMNTIEAYDAFLQKYPNSISTYEAQKQLEELRWKKVKSEDTISAYEAFLQKYPKGAFVEEASKRMKELDDWQTAQTENTVEGYESFLQKYSQSVLSQKAQKRIAELYFDRLQRTPIYQQWVNEQRNQKLTDHELVSVFSRSSGKIAQKLMNEVRATACQGQSSDYLLALPVSGTKGAIQLESEVNISLPDDLEAKTIGELYYVICLSIRKNNGETCKYSRFGIGPVIGYVIPQQMIWLVEIRESRTGKMIGNTNIYGIEPTCPSNISFKTDGETRYITGEYPDSSHLFDWIRKILEENIQK